MLNYILPPIVIIVATSALIVFLFKKSQQIPVQELVENEAENTDREKLSKRIIASLGQFWLKFLERLMHRIKLVSLKFHNVSNDWFHSIREKRQQKIQMQKEAEENSVSNHGDVQMEIPQADIFKRRNPIRSIRKPLIKEPVVVAPAPQVKAKEKNKFEDVLIKRIAINPRDVEAYERLGDYYLENENFQDSMECFKQVLKLSPLNYKARLRMRRLEKLIG